MKKFLSSIALLAVLSSCSTIFNGGSQTVLANPSNVNDDNVIVDVTTPSGSYKTKLPATIVATPSTFSDLKIAVNDNCYEKNETIVKKSVTPSYWVNILIWPGLIVDALDGYMWKYDNQVMVPTTKLSSCKR